MMTIVVSVDEVGVSQKEIKKMVYY